jgi:hypothetical protein
MTATNKQLRIFESHGDSNRYTLCWGKPDQHAMYASHSSPRTPCVHFPRAVPIRDNLSLAPTKSKQAPTPGRSLGNQRQTSPAIILGGIIHPPMRQPWSRGERFQPNGYTATLALDPYHQHVIGTFNTCSREPTHRSLTDIGGGYNLGGVGLPHTHSPTFPTSCLPFPPKGPVRSLV